MKKPITKTDQNDSFSTRISVDQSAKEVFEAINHVRGWWSEAIEGITNRLNAEFLQYYRDIHIVKMRIVEFTPDKKVRWLVLDSHLSFTTDKKEWRDTEICFDIARKNNHTELLFTHSGLVPKLECYEACNDAWNDLINLSLRSLIVKGKGRPNPMEAKSFDAGRTKRWKLSNE